MHLRVAKERLIQLRNLRRIDVLVSRSQSVCDFFVELPRFIGCRLFSLFFFSSHTNLKPILYIQTVSTSRTKTSTSVLGNPK
jgi:hypothetical protein